jgi:hypothetical protein
MTILLGKRKSSVTGCGRLEREPNPVDSGRPAARHHGDRYD